MHAATPGAFRHNVATYAQFWGYVGNFVKLGYGTATVKLCCCVYQGGMVFSISLEALMRISYPEIMDLFDSESGDACDFEELIEVQANGILDKVCSN